MVILGGWVFLMSEVPLYMVADVLVHCGRVGHIPRIY